MDKQEYLSEEQYQKHEKKLLGLSKIIFAAGICLSVGIIVFGAIMTNSENSKNKVEKVDYVAEANAEIGKLENELNEKQSKFSLEEEAVATKKNELIAKGIKSSSNYNDGESYDLYILDHALDPSFKYCNFDEYKNNSLTKEYCSLKNDIRSLEEQIQSKQEYISSGRAASETAEKNAYLEKVASWSSSFNGSGFTRYIIMAASAFMVPGMVALSLFLTAKRRDIAAFHVQGTMPIAQEGIKKMTPTISKAGSDIMKEMAPAYGEVAKEIAKGVKEGMKGKNKNKNKSKAKGKK